MKDTKVDAGTVIGKCKTLPIYDSDGGIIIDDREYEIVRIIEFNDGHREYITNTLVTDHNNDPGYLLTLHEACMSWIIINTIP